MADPVSPTRWHYLLPLTTVLIWSGNTLVTKLAHGRIDPEAILFYRWLLAALLMTPLLLPLLWRQRHLLRPHLLRLLVLGVLGMVVYQGLAYYAAATTSATNMAILLALSPLLAGLIGSALTADRLTWGVVIGGLVSFAGVVWLISGGAPLTLLHTRPQPGDALMLIAVTANALYGALLLRWQFPFSHWLQLYIQILAAMLVLTPWFAVTTTAPVTAAGLPLVLYAGVLASVGAPLLWIKSIQALGPGRASLFLNLTPVFVALAAMLWLDEQLAGYHLVGGLLALAGVALGQRIRRPLRR
ncbi:DMT family transporter [Isoalcanivorax beigongshangi]|uniref:DMT family transporter n=1 Tax=Isoalcanivorax beigongshangi TaxID=3238810 RepID=A0ABV4AIL8_9GAMM